MRARRAAVPRFPMAPGSYDANNEQQFRSQVERAIQDAIHAVPQPPEVKVEASRSGDSATMTLTVLDAGRRVQAIEFNKREGSDSATGWVDTWDTSTGTIGADYTLVRAEAVSIPAGLDSAAEWRVRYRDQDGASKTVGGPVPLSNLASVSKTLRIPHTAFVPYTEAVTWIYNDFALDTNGGPAAQFKGTLILPNGVTMTEVRVRALGGHEVYIYRIDDTPSSTLLDSVNNSGHGATWTTATLSMTEPVSSTTYHITVVLSGSSSALSWVEVDYTAPDYSKTY